MRTSRSLEVQLAAVALAVAGCGGTVEPGADEVSVASAESAHTEASSRGRCREVELEATLGYQPSRAVDGVKHLDSSFEFELPEQAPVKSGNSGKGWLQLSFTRGGVTTTCLYQGGGDRGRDDGRGHKEEERGSRYSFSACSSGEAPGAKIRTQDLRLHIESGNRNEGTTKVKLSISERKPCGAIDRCATLLPADLDDRNACTVDSCDPATGVKHTPAAEGTSCSDGDACNGAETCDAAATCRNGASPAVDDGNPCTADACDAKTGVSHTALARGTACGDGDACNGGETCDGAGACVDGAAPAVDDANPCTADACDPATGVSHVPLAAGASCEDGNACNGSESCDGAGTCLAGLAPAVDDANDCTTDACDPATGVSHTALAAGAFCGDGDLCNGAERCDGAGTCLAGTPLVADDANPCTADACDPVVGIVHQDLESGTSCSDGNACNGWETCNGAGTCTAGAAPPVDDGNACTADACDPASGVSHVALAMGTACGDGDACNGAEACDGAGTCVGSSAPVVDDGNPCTADACDPAAGVTHTDLPHGASCGDGNACNGEEICDGFGACHGGLPPTVDDRNPCTADLCDPVRGVVHTPVAAGTSCADANVCNGGETCNATGSCVAGTPLVTDDANPCTTDSCDPRLGVKHTPRSAGASCSDGNACNGSETCNATGSCQAGSAPVLDDRNPCTADSCSPSTGIAHTPVPQGSNCDDGNVCNGFEACNATGACTRIAPPPPFCI